MAISHRRLTLERFLELPEEEPPLEFEEGRAEPKMTPRARHSSLQAELIARLLPAARRARARVLPELRVTFGGRSYVPDLSLILIERLPRESDGTIADIVPLAPDIAIEIRSPGQSLSSLIRRCNWYVANGVRLALVVDPDDRSVFLFRPGVPVHVLRGDERIDLGDVLPGFAVTPRRLFASLRVVSA
jgi:Uma2 family endonuclease